MRFFISPLQQPGDCRASLAMTGEAYREIAALRSQIREQFSL